MSEIADLTRDIEGLQACLKHLPDVQADFIYGENHHIIHKRLKKNALDFLSSLPLPSRVSSLANLRAAVPSTKIQLDESLTRKDCLTVT